VRVEGSTGSLSDEARALVFALWRFFGEENRDMLYRAVTRVRAMRALPRAALPKAVEDLSRPSKSDDESTRPSSSSESLDGSGAFGSPLRLASVKAKEAEEGSKVKERLFAAIDAGRPERGQDRPTSAAAAGAGGIEPVSMGGSLMGSRVQLVPLETREDVLVARSSRHESRAKNLAMRRSLPSLRLPSQ
jgi:hypothetical protein